MAGLLEVPTPLLSKLCRASQRCKSSQKLLVTSYIDTLNPDREKNPIDFGIKHALEGGSPHRATITLVAGNMYGLSYDEVAPLALAIEQIHAQSLVLDDISDGDEERRGKPALHTIIGDQSAIIIASSLGNAASTSVANVQLFSPFRRPSALAEYFEDTKKALGNGQIMDLENTNGSTLDQLKQIAALKTGKGFEMSLVPVAMLAGPGDDEIAILEEISKHIGIVFQIQNDIKGAQKDEAKGKTTFARFCSPTRPSSLITAPHMDRIVELTHQLPRNTSDFLSLLDKVLA